MTSAEGLKLVFTESPVATIVIDREGHVVEVNRAAVKAMARARDRLVGTPVLAWIVPEDRDRARDNFVKAMGGRSSDWTVRVKRGDGVTRVFSLRTVPLAGNGSGGGLLTFARDLTAPREGRPDVEQLQALLENLPGQFVVALDRGGRIRYSSGLSRTFLIHDEDHVGEPLGTLVSRDSRNVELAEYLLEELKAGRDWGGLLWYRAGDATRVPAHTFATPNRDPKSGRILGGLVAGRDARKELARSERARRSRRLASIGRMVGDVSTSLATQLAEAEGEAGSDGEGSTGQGAPGLALARLSRSLDVIGRYAAAAEQELETISVVEAVEAALGRRRTRIEEMGVEVSRVLDPDAPPVYTDRAQLAAALDALIENAMEALEGSESRQMRIEVSAEPSHVTVEVADSGNALDPQAADRIFEPFVTTKRGRAGLGLAVVRAFVDGHGGSVGAVVKDGWTRFTLELGQHGCDASIAFSLAPTTSSRARSVLVVDDEEAVRKSIRKFLEKVGYEVREAWSGRSALAQVTAGDPPELVLTDLKMADGSGYWFLTEVSRDFPDLIKKTVVLTGDAQSEEAAQLLRETGCPIIRKPVELSHLLEVLDDVAMAR